MRVLPLATMFSIDDRFEDPFDLGELGRKLGEFLSDNFGPEKPGALVGTLGLPAAIGSGLLETPNIELGGKPYDIRADWSESIVGFGTVEDCPCKDY